MNSRYGSSSYLASSSSSSDDDGDYYDDLEKQVVCQITADNNFCIAQHQNNEGSHKGSIPDHIVVNHDRENVDRNLFNDYFVEKPRCSAEDSEWVVLYSFIFMMLYKVMTITSSNEEMDSVFGTRYLRSPNDDDVARLLHIGESRGFPGMLGSLDCMHWKWENCPTTWGGQYAGRSGSSTIILEVVADYDLWIWHAYFGLPGSNNDINVLEASHLFADLVAGISPPANYFIKGKEYNMCYYLADGIYPKWSIIVQTIREPLGPKK
ncbi:uncharacterized protein LOC133785770 [Humulus lupulus]|uniref:uncharacterized protein LOC133785770 n=1 Tax=Humulus lupulus TaxID=3486 RepID=UPI002B40E655|nr:uncharacterized protein LOC133785770 [Humulus lupulus]